MAMRPRGGGAAPTRPGRTTTVRPVYETFTPVFERQQEEEAEKLLIYLPGFPLNFFSPIFTFYCLPFFLTISPSRK